MNFFVHVWGNGANFDNTIFAPFIRTAGDPPARGVTTTIAMYAQSLSWGKAIDFDARTAIPFEGERHNALDDARYRGQKYVSAIWQKLIPSQADS
ncbi:3'-5' exoribonuclease [Escherichia coli]|nr:3'-5' exoribonuclease [Escherichia coli]